MSSGMINGNLASEAYRLDPTDRLLIRLSQAGLEISAHPFRELADKAGISEGEVLKRMARMQEFGVIRRIAAVPNHYRIGFKANGMTVWDVEDSQVDELGQRVGDLEIVSHCYRRPRHAGIWPYNLFAMVHGATREEVMAKAEQIRTMLGPACRGYDVLMSKRILKKTGFRMGE